MARAPSARSFGSALSSVVASVGAIALASVPARADAPAPATLIADPPALAAWLRDHDARVAAADARVVEAAAARAQAGVLPNPTLDLGYGDLVLGAGNPSTAPNGLGRTTRLDLGIAETIELGKRGPRRAAAGLREEAARDDRIATLGARLGDALAALGRVAYLAARRDALAADLADQQRLVALEQVRLTAQDLSRDDFARLELETQRLLVEAARADAEHRQALAVCAATLRSSCDAPLGPDALDRGAPLPAAPVDPGAAIAGRAALAASRARQAALIEDARLAARRAIPDPTVGLTYSHDNLTAAGNQPDTLMLSMSVPLPVFDRGRHDAAAARAEARALADEDDAARAEARGQVDALGSQLAALEQEIAALATDSVPRADAILISTRKAFDLGQDSLADLILAERGRRELVLALLDARYDRFAARAALRQALGLDDADARR